MKRAAPHRFGGSGGFTLIESVVVLAVLGIAAAGIVTIQGNIFSGRSDNRVIEVGTQLMQECAEQIVATRQRSGGYDLVTTSTCSTLGNYGGFGAPSVTITADTSAACPSGSTCNQVVISVSKSGSTLTPVTLELISY